MASKLTKLSKRQAILSDDEKTNQRVLRFYSKFKITRLKQPADAVKVKDYLASALVFVLCIYRLKGIVFCRSSNIMALRRNSQEAFWFLSHASEPFPLYHLL